MNKDTTESFRSFVKGLYPEVQVIMSKCICHTCKAIFVVHLVNKNILLLVGLRGMFNTDLLLSCDQ